jgi:uncharacterized membrane protein YgaE (UPF0421/DUF939 family)
MPEPTPRPSWRIALARGVSSALVAVFCYATVNQVPSLSEPYWAPMAAVIVLYPTREATKNAAFDRFSGTIIGCVIGCGSAMWWHDNILFYGGAIVAAVAVCTLLRLENASRLSAVAVSVLTLVPHVESAQMAALHRFLEVSYGVACALGYTLVADFVGARWRRRRVAHSEP